MARGHNKYRDDENLARIREVLMREWDLIGVSGVPEAADEYDSYVGGVYMMLMQGRASSEAIAAYLFDIATRHMGLSAHAAELAERSARAAAALVALRPEFETH
jgi:hypothetical protein